MGTKTTFELEPHVLNAIAGVEAARAEAERRGVLVSQPSYTTLEDKGPAPAM